MRTGSLELSRLGKQALRAGGDDHTAAQVGGVRAGLRRAAHAALYFPDAQVGWTRRPCGGAPRTAPPTVDAVVSSSFPITAHLVARRLPRERCAVGGRVPRPLERDRRLARAARAVRLERSLAADASAVS